MAGRKNEHSLQKGALLAILHLTLTHNLACAYTTACIWRNQDVSENGLQDWNLKQQIKWKQKVRLKLWNKRKKRKKVAGTEWWQEVKQNRL